MRIRDEKDPNCECKKTTYQAIDLNSYSSGSSFCGFIPKQAAESNEKVASWLQNDPKIGDITQPVRLDCVAQQAPLRDKVQSLLTFGEYSLFKKWRVLVEGDFVSVRQQDAERLAKGEKITDRQKVSLNEIRTLAITSNWLIVARMKRLYHTENDAIVPCGISLELRKLVPLKYVEIFVTRPALEVIGIQNSCGVRKEYKFVNQPDPMCTNTFLKFRHVIGCLKPNLADDTLLTTLHTFGRWQRQHACRWGGRAVCSHQNQIGALLCLTSKHK